MTPFRQYNAYIDESGDEGWRKVGQRKSGANDASSEWLILGAAISHAEHDAKNMRVIDELRETTKKSQSRKPLKWRSLENDHYKKRLVADTLGSHPTLLFSVAALWKPALENAPGLRKRGYLYHTTGRYLIERLSWLAWDTPGASKRQLNLFFESRKQTSYDDLEAYMRRLENDPEATIKKGSIRHVQPVNPSVKGAQVADLVVGAVQDALEPNHRGDLEPDYLQRLRGRIFCRQGSSVLKYGLKIFPPEVLDEPRYRWLRDF
jgi:uncharacterized protein DUF3800